MEIIEKICKDATNRDYDYIFYIELHENGYVVSTCEEDGTSYEDDVLYLYDIDGRLVANDWGTVTETCGKFKQKVDVPEGYRYKKSD